MNRGSALALLLAFAGALALRSPQLGVRPLHNDEAVNATKLAVLWEQGKYRYDPDEYHGPALHYFSLPFLWLSPAKNSAELTDGTLRAVTVAFGAGLILLLVLLGDGLGQTAIVWSAVLIALSPAMVFYSRYFIHEMLLVFFSLLTLAAVWRYAQSRKAGWALLAGAGFGLMWATKETFVLSVAAGFIAWAGERSWSCWRQEPKPGIVAAVKGHERWAQMSKHLLFALLTAFAVAQLFFTSFLTNAAGLVDSVKTFFPWFHRAGGESWHVHPWDFYFARLIWFHPARSPVWTEALILILAAVGACAAFLNSFVAGLSRSFARFLVFYTVALTTIYCIIPYKTPWCLLNFWLGMILLGGLGAATIVRFCRTRIKRLATIAALTAGMIHLAWQSRLAAVEYAASPRNPYVYSQTAEGCRELAQRVEEVSQVAAGGSNTLVKVISPESYWPLPWYLRRFKNTGWWEQMPIDPYAPIIIVSAKLEAALDEKSNKGYVMTGLYELRPGVFLELYVQRELWGEFVTRKPSTTQSSRGKMPGVAVSRQGCNLKTDEPEIVNHPRAVPGVKLSGSPQLS